MSSIAEKIQDIIDIVTELILIGDRRSVWLIGTPYQCAMVKEELLIYARDHKLGFVSSSTAMQISLVSFHQIHPAFIHKAFQSDEPTIDLRDIL